MDFDVFFRLLVCACSHSSDKAQEELRLSGPTVEAPESTTYCNKIATQLVTHMFGFQAAKGNAEITGLGEHTPTTSPVD